MALRPAGAALGLVLAGASPGALGLIGCLLGFWPAELLPAGGDRRG